MDRNAVLVAVDLGVLGHLLLAASASVLVTVGAIVLLPPHQWRGEEIHLRRLVLRILLDHGDGILVVLDARQIISTNSLDLEYIGWLLLGDAGDGALLVWEDIAGIQTLGFAAVLQLGTEVVVLQLVIRLLGDHPVLSLGPGFLVDENQPLREFLP